MAALRFHAVVGDGSPQLRLELATAREVRKLAGFDRVEGTGSEVQAFLICTESRPWQPALATIMCYSAHVNDGSNLQYILCTRIAAVCKGGIERAANTRLQVRLVMGRSKGEHECCQ